MSETTGADVAAKAAEIIRERGWTHNTMESGGHVCAVRALILAGKHFGDHDPHGLGYGMNYQAGRQEVLKRLSAHPELDRRASTPGTAQRYITQWNDHKDTDEAHVLAVLEGRL